jgi:hypothetical protein
MDLVLDETSTFFNFSFTDFFGFKVSMIEVFIFMYRHHQPLAFYGIFCATEYETKVNRGLLF